MEGGKKGELVSVLFGSVGEVGVSPVSPREEHFGRGGGPHVDQFALREKEDRRRRELENRVSRGWVSGWGWVNVVSTALMAVSLPPRST